MDVITPKSNRFIDITGKRFGKLVAIHPIGISNDNKLVLLKIPSPVFTVKEIEPIPTEFHSTVQAVSVSLIMVPPLTFQVVSGVGPKLPDKV